VDCVASNIVVVSNFVRYQKTGGSMSDRKQNLHFFFLPEMRCLLQHRDCFCQDPLSLTYTHIHRFNVVFFIFCMQLLVPVWYLTIFQNAIIVCVCVCVCVQIWPPHSYDINLRDFFVWVLWRTNCTHRNMFISGTHSFDLPAVLHTCRRLAVQWSYTYKFVLRR